MSPVIDSDAVINPVKGKNSPALGPVAVMAAAENDLDLLCTLLKLDPKSCQKLFISRLYVNGQGPNRFSLIGPFIGAPYAAMLLETLIAWGARMIIVLGWCGAISEKVKIGDIILPTSALIDEGTSKHYRSDTWSAPSDKLVVKVRQLLQQDKIDFHEGSVWSTDAVFRETRRKVDDFKKRDILAVEMEISALFTVGRFRLVKVGAVLVVSDELSISPWRPGFKDKRFAQGRITACRVVEKLCQMLSIQR
jgi:purine-nucleoside phosphorylase